VIEEYLDDIKKKKYEHIARKLAISIDEVIKAVKL